MCPFADESPNETEIASEAFPDVKTSTPELGKYLDVFTARVNDEDYLTGSSSGGMTSWLLVRLLEEGLVDGIIHVGSGTDPLFSYRVSHNSEDLLSNRKSAYYSTSMADAVSSIRGNGLRYAVVGVPCFITAARHLARQDEALGRQLMLFVGLVCGHLKSSAFAELLAWQAGTAPRSIRSVDFRVKIRGSDASKYNFAVVDDDGSEKQALTSSLVGGSWGTGMFQLSACNYCDDIFAETADVVLGDAWLPEYRSDWRGTNIVVVRNEAIENILHAGDRTDAITLEPLAADRAAASQAGNFRHRRDGLALRLHDDVKRGIWTPTKRVLASDQNLDESRKAVIRTRRALSAESHEAFALARESGNIDEFFAAIRPRLERYERAARKPPLLRLRSRVARMYRTARSLTGKSLKHDQ